MSVFDLAVDAQFEDPNLGLDAIWRAGGAETGLPVRVRRRSPEAIIGAAGNQFDLDAMLIDVRLSEVAEPAEQDEIDLLDEDGAVTETVQVIGLARIDTRRLVRTCEVAPVLPDEPDEDDEP
ncbi:head-tail joining protein [Methylorubrum extorquens]